QLMDIVMRESERLNDTVGSFLSYAKPQGHRPQVVDLEQILEESAALLRNSPELRTGHQIVVGAGRAPCRATADESQMRQVIWNLATNALRSMPGGGRLELGVESTGDH